MTIRPADGPVRAVVLILHGGQVTSLAPTRPSQLSAVRMIPFAAALERAGERIDVWTLRYRHRGWNGAQASPVADARWALDEVRRRHGSVPIALVGHSMGGRTALRVADDPDVRGVVALAPWLPSGEPVEAIRGRRLLIAHGTRDCWTDLGGSLAYARRAESLAAEVRHVSIRGVGHPMLRRMSLWHGLTTLHTIETLADRTADDAATNAPEKTRTERAQLLI
ncbi:alpha/beta hydrolase [Fodinicola feengrottensis]|uniref:alpha/beta hydrolase n=1 Tax=Fodinicola feengrottensis TaxID=435914 RepID=UPI0024428CE1|nr:alpha/beta fold hydrolase [Fodinicola feengrottensis]